MNRQTRKHGQEDLEKRSGMIKPGKNRRYYENQPQELHRCGGGEGCNELNPVRLDSAGMLSRRLITITRVTRSSTSYKRVGEELGPGPGLLPQFLILDIVVFFQLM